MHADSADAAGVKFALQSALTCGCFRVHGGVQPQWRADGRELFYLAPDGTLMSVGVEPGGEFVARAPATLFRTSADPTPNRPQYTVTADGKRFLALDAGESRAQTFTFLLNLIRPGDTTRK